MSLFIETIKIQYGKLYNIAYHNARANTTRRNVLGMDRSLDLAAHILIPADLGRGIYKCRVVYGEEVQDVNIERYFKRKIRSLKLVEGGMIDYSYKYVDRTSINLLYAQRGSCDDILIIKEGLITDTSFANVAFFNGKTWVTPAAPLLLGTKRQELLDKGELHEALIRPSDLHRYSMFAVINAMLAFNPSLGQPKSGIVR
jgi:4-amino-4-deoxychorismate lyase